MKDIKFRFVNKIKKTGEIKFVFTSINDLEMEDSCQGKVNYERLGVNLFIWFVDCFREEIYEGDILNIVKDIGNGVNYTEKGVVVVWDYEFLAELGYASKLIKIGNIYENPELLNE